MAKMRAVQVPKAGGELERVEREIPEPRPGTVRVKVQACGICHSDSVTVEGLLPGIEYPRVPGHEVVGEVDKGGDGVKGWKVGDRVGIGWHGGQCGYCHNCRRGDFFACLNEHLTTGVTFDGGYAEYLVAPASGLAAVPEGLGAVDAAPLVCAGVTTFNCLRNTGARPGALVAVLGPWASGRAVCGEDGLQDGGDCARRGQSRVREEDGRGGVYRQPGTGPLGGAAEAWRREGCAGHGYKCGCNDGGDGRAGGEGRVHDRGRGSEAGGPVAANAVGVAGSARVVLGD